MEGTESFWLAYQQYQQTEYNLREAYIRTQNLMYLCSLKAFTVTDSGFIQMHANYGIMRLMDSMLHTTPLHADTAQLLIDQLVEKVKEE